MARTIQILAALLVVQLLLALGLSFTGPDLSAQASQSAMLSLDKDRLDSLIVEGPNRAKVVLAKTEGSWRLAEERDFPADSARVTQLIDRLAGVKLGQPVATTTGALERFKVNDSAFERRITLASGGKTLATVYLGTSIGLRQTHIRPADRDAVYVADLAVYDLPAKPEDWENKGILQYPKSDIEAIDVVGLRLARTAAEANAGTPSVQAKAGEGQTAGGDAEESSTESAAASKPGWEARGLTSKRLNVEAADKLAGLLAELRIGTVLGREEKPAYGLTHPMLTLSVTRKGGNKTEYRLGRTAEKEEAYVLKTSTRPEYFRLPGFVAKPLLDAAKHEALVAAHAAGKSAEGAKTQQREARNE